MPLRHPLPRSEHAQDQMHSAAVYPQMNLEEQQQVASALRAACRDSRQDSRLLGVQEADKADSRACPLTPRNPLQSFARTDPEDIRRSRGREA